MSVPAPNPNTLLSLFVFYEPGGSFSSWTYQYSNNWEWIGGGLTNPLDGDEQERYTMSREDQFEGPRASLRDTYELLEQQLQELQNQDVIRCFKICSTYTPS